MSHFIPLAHTVLYHFSPPDSIVLTPALFFICRNLGNVLKVRERVFERGKQ